MLLLRPMPPPSPLVHVEITLTHAESAAGPWRLARGAADHVAHAAARDDGGDIAVDVAAAGPGVELRLARAPRGTVTMAYDIVAGGDAPDDPRGIFLVDDRFRAPGDRLVALPEAADGARGSALVRVDGQPLRAAGAASSLGVGFERRETIPFRALRYTMFLAGSLGAQKIDDPGAGHDEGAWLGYTTFDPRTTVAELAVVRSSLRELLKSYVDPGSWTYLLASQVRPLGSFTTTPGWENTLLQVGPGEPWGAALRLSMAQQLARRWIGGELRVKTAHAGEGAWFSEGVSRYVAMLVLDRLGLMGPADVRDAVGGELSVLATSPDRAMDYAGLTQHADHDDVARATAMARGALYALGEAARIRARTHGERGLDAVLVALVHQAEERKDGAFAVDAWLDAVSREDPDAKAWFDAAVVRGTSVALPASALGPCFRPGTGEYTAFDAGFDLEATRTSADGKALGVRPDGPAARAGLKDGDVVESMQARDGDASVPVKLVVLRAGAKVTLTYAPRGAHGRGQTWTRVAGIPDERCGEVP